jgi:hypothetical protein
MVALKILVLLDWMFHTKQYVFVGGSCWATPF